MLKKAGSRTAPTDVIDEIDPKVNNFKVDPVEYGRHIEMVPPRVDKEGNIEVDPGDGGIELNKEHEGIELDIQRDFYGRPSVATSTLAELPSEKQSAEVGEGDRLKTRRCGLKKRPFWVLLGLIIFIVIGGIPKTPSPVLSGSNLVAVNWTTADNKTTYLIFTQAPDQSLVAYTGQTNAWIKVNISQVFEDTNGLGIRASSPLAAVANSDLYNYTEPQADKLTLYFLTRDNVVTQLVTHDATLENWDWGDIGPHSDVNIMAAPGSLLAAAWQRCNNFTSCGNGCLSLTYEDTQQNYMIANSTHAWAPVIASDRLAENSSLALISMNYGNGSDYLWGFFNTNGILGSAWQDFENGNWFWTDLGRNVLEHVPTSALQHFAATSFRDRTHAFIAALFPDGAIIGKHWDPALNNWHPPANLNLVGSTQANFSTITMTADARFYGIIADGTIQEYQMDVDDPFTFHWLGTVS
ncbi:hypothetical protein HD806DRAFT_543360 [Xylariaceae sp. AK1471]|nr:hypothetical protein HD806DRAFT_543360 [Xylariaceae sp. AK1471]